MFHGPFKNACAYALAGVSIAVLLSAATFYSPSWFGYAFWSILLATGIVGLRRFDVAVFMLLAELFVGSQGRLFNIELFGFPLSLRMGMFAVVALLWIVQRRWKTMADLRTAPISWWSLLFLCLLVLGTAIGYFLGNNRSFLFFDVNGYLFLLAGVFFFSVIRSKDDVERVLGVFGASTVFSTVFVLILLAVFSHGYEGSHEVYRWLRDTRMFEITGIGNNYYRIFSQAHIFSLLAFFVFFVLWAFTKQEQSGKRFSLFVAGCSGLTLLLSFSRSFWVAACLTVVLMLPWLFRKARQIGVRLGIVSLTLIAVLIVDALLITFTANYPLLYGRSGGKTAIQVIGERSTDVGEPAAASRYALLKPLVKAGLQYPVFGSGFGASLTYTTSDPRIVAQTGGAYTTYAFEWGYLDFFFKLGILGLAVIIGIFLALYQESRALLSRLGRGKRDFALVAGLLLSLIALFLTHALTPYLNHPTGLGFIMLMAAVLRVYREKSHSFVIHDETKSGN